MESSFLRCMLLHNTGILKKGSVASAMGSLLKACSFFIAVLCFIAGDATAQSRALSEAGSYNADASRNYSAFSNNNTASPAGREPVQDRNNTYETSTTNYSPGSNPEQYAERLPFEHNSAVAAPNVKDEPHAMSATPGYPGSPAMRRTPLPGSSYPYYSCPATKFKSYCHHHDKAHIACRKPLPLAFIASCFPYFLNYPFSFEDFDSFNEEKDSYVELHSFDGYVVYGKDTLPGIVTFNKNIVYLENSYSPGHRGVCSFLLAGKALHAVTVYYGNHELYLVRLSENEKRLSRVLHTGKLNIYDDSYKFPTADNIHKSGLRIVYGGQMKSLKTSGDTKKELIDHINAVYGLNLDANSFSWQGLLRYIDKLD
jgi:hypothetical protein